MRVRGAFENDDTINRDIDDLGSISAGCACVWEKGVVVQIGRDSAGGDAGEDADGAEKKQEEDEEVDPSRMVLVAVMASSTSESCSSANAKKQWVNLDGEDVCQEGTHLSGCVVDSRCVYVRNVERFTSTIITWAIETSAECVHVWQTIVQCKPKKWCRDCAFAVQGMCFYCLSPRPKQWSRRRRFVTWQNSPYASLHHERGISCGVDAVALPLRLAVAPVCGCAFASKFMMNV